MERAIPMIVGILLLLMGTVFALQGGGMAGTGSPMDNNPMWIYVGSAVAVLGLVVIVVGFVVTAQKAKSSASVVPS